MTLFKPNFFLTSTTTTSANFSTTTTTITRHVPKRVHYLLASNSPHHLKGSTEEFNTGTGDQPLQYVFYDFFMTLLNDFIARLRVRMVMNERPPPPLHTNTRMTKMMTNGHHNTRMKTCLRVSSLRCVFLHF